MARRRGPARWPLVVLVALFVAVGVSALLRGDDDGDDAGAVARTTTSAGIERPVEVPLTDVPGDPSPVVVARHDVAVTYRVEGSTAEGGAVIDTERRWVRVPYESRVETTPGEDEEAAATFLQIAGFGELQTGRESEEPAPLAVEPGVAPGDVFVDVSSLAWQHQERSVLGRTCQVYRNGSPIDVGTVTPATDDHVDLCVTEEGLLLHEEWVIGGTVFRVRIATEIDESPSLRDSLFEPTGVPPEGVRGGILAELTPDSVPPDVAFYAPPSTPEGYRHRGRYGYTPPRAQLEINQPEPTKVAQVLDVYESDDGAGLLVVANGGTSDRSAYFQPGEDSERIDLGALGEGYVLRGLRQNEVRVGFEHGRFLRVWGTASVDDLAALARALTPTTDPDGTLTPV